MTLTQIAYVLRADNVERIFLPIVFAVVFGFLLGIYSRPPEPTLAELSNRALELEESIRNLHHVCEVMP